MPAGYHRSRCPDCESTIRIRDDQRGRRLRCPVCRTRWTDGAESSVPRSSTSVPSPSRS
ncbi:MAG: MJ0042-type zinc finger domain-containing protein, partial [Planctomycetia bacterium]